MSQLTSGEVTKLLNRWSQGDAQALSELVPLVYRELRRTAARYLRRERAEHTLQPTALAHEAYLRLVGQSRVHWRNREHFFAIAAQAMRRLLVDHARKRKASKRGGGELHVALDERVAADAAPRAELVALDDALEVLSAIDARQVRIVELRYFGGLSVEETAKVLGLSPATIKREWATARLWLRRELSRGQP